MATVLSANISHSLLSTRDHVTDVSTSQVRKKLQKKVTRSEPGLIKLGYLKCVCVCLRFVRAAHNMQMNHNPRDDITVVCLKCSLSVDAVVVSTCSKTESRQFDRTREIVGIIGAVSIHLADNIDFETN